MFNTLLFGRWIIIVLLFACPAHAGAGDQYYLISSGTGAIHKYSLTGDFISDLVPANANQLGNPQHMVIRDGKVFVPGYANNKLARIDLKTGVIEAQWDLDGARGIAFLRESKDGTELWVSSITSARILRVDPNTGSVSGDLITAGLIPGPHGIIDGPADSLLVAGSDRVIYQVNGHDDVVPLLSVPLSNRPTNMIMLNDNTLLLTAFASNTERSLRSYNTTTGEDLGRYSDTQGSRADGLVRGYNNEILAVFWGSSSIARYNDTGDFLGYLVAPGSQLSGPNHIILVTEPPTPCPADLTADGILDFFDVSAFLQAFATADPIADFTDDGIFDFFDISAFLSAFAAGCP